MPDIPKIRKIKRICIIQLRPYGDVFLATAYLEALCRHCDTPGVDFVVCRPYHTILRNHPYIAGCIDFREAKGIPYIITRISILMAIRRRRYDLVIDQQNGTGSRILTMFSGAPWRLGWSHHRLKAGINIVAHPMATPRYSAVRNFDMVFPLGIPWAPFKMYVDPTDEARQEIRAWLDNCTNSNKRLIAVAPGSKNPRKQWNTGQYIDLIQKMIDHLDAAVILIGAPQEEQVVQRVLDHTSENCLRAPTRSIDHAVALLQYVSLLVCNDCALNHISVATSTPVLAIFGPTSPLAWSPQGFFPGHFHLHNPLWNQSDGDGFGITAEMAFAKVSDILDELQ